MIFIQRANYFDNLSQCKSFFFKLDDLKANVYQLINLTPKIVNFFMSKMIQVESLFSNFSGHGTNQQSKEPHEGVAHSQTLHEYLCRRKW